MESESFILSRVILFIILSLLLAVWSWKPLQNPHSHGFYRFFAFEGIVALIIMNLPYWFNDPFSPLQLLSWSILSFSILFVYHGFRLLKKRGDSDKYRETSPENLKFENTTKLVTEGIYNYIRHPMYSSLFLLTWGAFLKHLTFYGLTISLITSVLLLVTAKCEELENISFFGSIYVDYMKRTKLFIPYFF